MSTVIDLAAGECQGLAKLAAALGESPQAVANWRTRGIPTEKCPAIERATSGVVTCEAARPDITWVRVKDPAWPWHPKGRPLVDVAAEATKAGA